jgi:hypothetical protein
MYPDPAEGLARGANDLALDLDTAVVPELVGLLTGARISAVNRIAAGCRNDGEGK